MAAAPSAQASSRRSSRNHVLMLSWKLNLHFWRASSVAFCTLLSHGVSRIAAGALANVLSCNEPHLIQSHEVTCTPESTSSSAWHFVFRSAICQLVAPSELGRHISVQLDASPAQLT